MALGKKLPFNDKYTGKENDYLFPSSNVDPDYKTDPKGEYVKKMIESMYAKYLNGSLGGTDIYEKADILQAYGRGTQPESIYKTWAYGGQSYPTAFIQNIVAGIDVNVDGLSDSLMKGWHNVNFSVVSPMPKIKETIKGMLDKVDYEIHADTLDPISNDKKERERLKLLVRAKNKDWYDAQRQAMSLPDDTPSYLPETKEDLDIYEAYGGLKLQCARIQQMLIRYTYEISGWDEISDVLKDHLMDYGKAVIQDYVDLDDKKVKLKIKDPKTFFVQPSKYPDARDASYAGGVTEYDVSYLAAMGVPREKLEAVASQYCGLLGNPASEEWNIYNRAVNDTSYAYDFFKVAVVEASWIEEDTRYTRFYKNRFGKIRSKDVEFGYKAMKDNEWVKKYSKRMLYEGSWVINTDIVFSFGISYNQPKNGEKLKLPFHVFTLPYKSMVERAIPFLDEYMFCHLHYQNAMALSLPDGMAVDMSMMANITSTPGKTANIADILKFARSQGLYPYNKSITGKYEGGNPTPFSVVQGVKERILADTANRFMMCNERISDVTGINPMSIQGNVSATSAQLAYNATINVLKPIVKAIFRIKESGAESLCWRIQNAIKYEPSFKQSYSGIISDNDLSIVQDAEKNGVKYGIMLVARPSEEDIQSILESVDIDMQQGLLDTNDRMFVKEQINAKTDLKLIRMYIQSKVAKNKEEQRKNQMEAIERQNQGALQLRQAEGQNQQMKSQFEIQKETVSIGAKHQAKLEEDAANNEARWNEKMLELQNAINSVKQLQR